MKRSFILLLFLVIIFFTQGTMAYDNSINIDIFNSNGDHEPMMKPPLEDHDNGGVVLRTIYT